MTWTEYNKHLEGLKKTGKRLMIPDIFVHTRQNDGRNLLVVEVKRDGNEMKRGWRGISKDRKSLGDLTSKDEHKGQYRYEYGALILMMQEHTKIEWFKEPRKRFCITTFRLIPKHQATFTYR